MSDEATIGAAGWRAALTRPDPRRALLLCAAGALFGLGLAGWALFTAKGTSVAGVPPEDVALVNQRPILRSDFVTQLQLETGAELKDTTPEQRRKVLEEMLDEELLVQRGLEVDLAASDPDVRTAMVAGVNLQVDAEVLAQQPSEADLRKYFEAHREHYNSDGVMRLRDFVLAATAAQQTADVASKAQAASDALKQGGDPDITVVRFGLKDSARLDQGDNFEFGVRAKLGERLFEAASALSAGEVSPPVAQADGIHVLVMVQRRRAQAVDFDGSRDSVRQDYQRDARNAVEAANLAYLRGRAEIELAPEYAK
jgi:parvulin-like peptidyl-prolyl isomerase